MFKEFKEFAMKGNLLDLAIGFILGGAFGKIVSSFVNDIVMPPLGLLLGQVSFNDLFISLDGKTYASLQAAKDAGAATLNYGVFISSVIDFLIVAFLLFLLVRQVNRMRKPAAVPVAAPTTKTCPYCQSDIPINATRCPHCTSQL
jgi:large conductance mechanosensitive channel